MTEKVEEKEKSIAEILDEYCPFYMAIGMTYEEYWDGPAELTKFYREAHKIKKDIQNEQLWLQGRYMYETILRLIPVFNPFAQTEISPYIEQPFAITKEEIEKRQKEEAIRNMENMFAYMQSKIK